MVQISTFQKRHSLKRRCLKRRFLKRRSSREADFSSYPYQFSQISFQGVFLVRRLCITWRLFESAFCEGAFPESAFSECSPNYGNRFVNINEGILQNIVLWNASFIQNQAKVCCERSNFPKYFFVAR